MAQHIQNNWHFANSKLEFNAYEFHWTLIRFNEAFKRYVLTTSNVSITYHEHIILHVIWILDCPINSASVARLLNRHDITNIQYSLRKLESTGLIEKKLDRNGKTYSYKTTETGFKLTDEYYKHKEEVLIKRLDEISGISDKFHNAIKFLSLLTGIYDEAAQDSTKYFPPP